MVGAPNFANMHVFYASSDNTMIETNPIHARIADLTSRLASLRGYL